MTDNIFLLLNALVVIGTGTFISLIFVSQLWYHSMLLCEGELNNPTYKLYVQKYDLKELKNDEVSIKPNIKNILCETTENDGVIVMRYNEDREGFEYWADKKQINFDVLYTVCRKYCISFKNIDLYVDRKDEYEKQINDFKKKKKEEEEKE